MGAWAESPRGFGGDVADFPLTTVLQFLELGKKSGFLYVRDHPKIAFLVFREGAIVQAVSSLRRAGLGELLLAEGWISREDLNHALETQRRSPARKMLGEIFETLGHATHQQILQVLTQQMKEIVRWVLGWNSGEFTFYVEAASKTLGGDREQEMTLPAGIIVQEVLQEAISDRDRRRFPRVPVSIKVVQKLPGAELVWYTQNVSGGGLMILADRLPKEGEIVSLDLWVPTLLEPVATFCKVIRVQDGSVPGDSRGFAVEFQQITEEARNILERLGQVLEHIL